MARPSTDDERCHRRAVRGAHRAPSRAIRIRHRRVPRRHALHANRFHRGVPFLPPRCSPGARGAFLGITNTLGVAAGIAANLLTGYMVETTGSFRSVFLVTAGVYASSGLVWNANMRGRVMFP